MTVVVEGGAAGVDDGEGEALATTSHQGLLCSS